MQLLLIKEYSHYAACLSFISVLILFHNAAIMSERIEIETLTMNETIE